MTDRGPSSERTKKKKEKKGKENANDSCCSGKIDKRVLCLRSIESETQHNDHERMEQKQKQ